MLPKLTALLENRQPAHLQEAKAANWRNKLSQAKQKYVDPQAIRLSV
jgi:hypothetical protein